MWIVASLLPLIGCGYIGEPLPPLLNIPQHATDLAAVQRGDKIIVQFMLPKLTTEGVVIKGPLHWDLRAEVSGEAKSLGEAAPVDGRVRYELPAAPWVGNDVRLAVKVTGASGKDAGWSDAVVISVATPLPKPAEVSAQAVREGVRLSWRAAGPQYRIYRRAGDEKEFAVAATVNASEWTDTNTEYGKIYRYLVQTVSGKLESDPSDEASITTQDLFPPAVPGGLTAVPTANSIELAWEPVTDADLAGYRVYRAAAPDGEFERAGETGPVPSFSDRKIEAGKRYRYAVSSFDAKGNESERSPAIEVAVQ